VASIILPDQWKRQPQGAVELDSAYNVLSACLPVISGLGYGAAEKKPLAFHYTAAFHSITPTTNGYIFTQTGDDLREITLLIAGTRAPLTYFSYFSVIGSVADNTTVVSSNTPSTEGLLRVMADGSIKWTGDAGQDVQSAAGVVKTGLNFAEVYLISPTGSSTRTTKIYLNGVLVAQSTTAAFYINGSWVGPRQIDSPLHSSTTLGVHLCGAIANRNSELHKNPWQIFKPRKRVIYFDVFTFPVLSSLGVSYITSSGGRLTAN